MELRAGMLFECTINGDKCEGKVQKERGKFYLCQNVASGSTCSDLLGYASSWVVGNGSDKARSTANVSNFRVLHKSLEAIEEGDILVQGEFYTKVLGRAGQVVFRTFANSNLSKCKKSDTYKYTVTIAEIKAAGWEVYQEEEKDEPMIALPDGRKFSASTIQEALKKYVGDK